MVQPIFNCYLSIVFLFLFVNENIIGQNALIRGMKWGIDYQIYVTLSNDSSYVLDVKALYHAPLQNETDSSYVFYPVNLDKEFIAELKNKKLDDTGQQNYTDLQNKSHTLWSSLHEFLGGGRIHFINCLLYTIETSHLSLTAPLMERPVTKWKPNPPTESFLRTKNWKYYTPVTQKEAHKEFKIRKKENKLSELEGLPKDYITLFLKTSDRQYRKMIAEKQIKQIAKIELVKLLLGAPYLGQTQIDFIKSSVVKAVMEYSANNLPSVIIFDELKAAVVMTLNEEGYKTDRIEFADYETISFAEAETRREKINLVINRINHANQELFRSNLKRYYK